MASRYDVVVVGAGHNGLTCAAYLARSGLSVLVVEADDRVGGGCTTDEVAAPGFRHDLHSSLHGIIHMGPVYRDLDLARRGVQYIWPENQFAHVFPGGRALVFSRDLGRTVSNIALFSRPDAETFRDLAELYGRLFEETILPAMFPPPKVSKADERLRDRPALLQGHVGSGNDLARDLFECSEVQTSLGFWASRLAGIQSGLGTAAHFAAAIASSLEPYGWAVCRGGSSRLASALASAVTEAGGEIHMGAPVRQIEVRDGRCLGVVLDDGTSVGVGGALVSSLDPHHTAVELIGEQDLPDGQVAAFDLRTQPASTFGVYLAMGAPVQWKASEGEPTVGRCLAVSICESLDALEDNTSDSRLGILPQSAALMTVHPSLCDSSLCPDGAATSLCQQTVPNALRDGGLEAWDAIEDDYSDALLGQWAEHLTSGLEPGQIVGRYVSGPIDLERRRRGPRHADMYWTADQPGMGIENLYFCGAPGHLDGSIGGAGGYRAAGAVVRDLGIEPWWAGFSEHPA